MHVWSLAQHSGLKDLAFPQLWHRWQLQLGSDPWPGTPYAAGQPKIFLKIKKKKQKQKNASQPNYLHFQIEYSLKATATSVLGYGLKSGLLNSGLLRTRKLWRSKAFHIWSEEFLREGILTKARNGVEINQYQGKTTRRPKRKDPRIDSKSNLGQTENISDGSFL